MTEKEKQQAGELYNADDRELVNERIKSSARSTMLLSATTSRRGRGYSIGFWL